LNALHRAIEESPLGQPPIGKPAMPSIASTSTSKSVLDLNVIDRAARKLWQSLPIAATLLIT
jgi:hypothetical protein